MRPIKTSIIIITAIMISTAFSSCKKESTIVPVPTVPVCKITAVTVNGSTFNLTYDTGGRLITVKLNTTTVQLSYNGNMIIEDATIGIAFGSKTIVTLNPVNGLAANVKTETNPDGSKWNNHVYEYNGTELIKDTYTTSVNAIPVVTAYTWSNGNMVSYTNGTSTAVYEYYTDKAFQAGDYFALADEIQGYRTICSKNLAKSELKTGLPIHNINYSFDGTGKITLMSLSGTGTPADYAYQYQCK